MYIIQQSFSCLSTFEIDLTPISEFVANISSDSNKKSTDISISLISKLRSFNKTRLVIPGKAPLSIVGVKILLSLTTKIFVILPSATKPLEFNKIASSYPASIASFLAKILSK